MNIARSYYKNGYVTITNGLVSRVFKLWPNCAVTELCNNLINEKADIKPEAIIFFDEKKYEVGGAENAPFKFSDYTLAPIKTQLQITGLEAAFYYINENMPGISVVVFYKIYDNAADFSKSLTVFNYTENNINYYIHL